MGQANAVGPASIEGGFFQIIQSSFDNHKAAQLKTIQHKT